MYPDRVHFEKVVHDEVKAMFDNDIWVKARKQSIFTYYDGMQKARHDIKNKIMMIFPFKRKIHLEGRLNNYKAMVCYHGVQQ